jgi:UDP-2,3-diacylglucosamine pyrophosphatase LpxH
MRKILQYMINPLFQWAAKKFCGAPKEADVYKALYNIANQQQANSNVVIKQLQKEHKYILFSDHHKGSGKDGDDFASCAETYSQVLDYYFQEDYHLINLGDSEEFWKFSPEAIMKAYGHIIQKEAHFFEQHRYTKIYGNHDAFWTDEAFLKKYLGKFFHTLPNIVEAVILKTITSNNKPLDIIITHGHQGDKMSENNKRSIWIVRHIWAPIQRFLQLNVNTPSTDSDLKHKHNRIMYQWASTQQNTLLMAGHTHKPVFASGRYSPHESNYIGLTQEHNNYNPCYFNTGSCCNQSGSITGIEIEHDTISLVIWRIINGRLKAFRPESASIKRIASDLGNKKAKKVAFSV